MTPKFRVWHNVGKRFIDLENEEDIYYLELTYGYVHYGQNGDLVDVANVEIMQSTHMRDKNNKEIYEGDIVHQTVRNPSMSGYFLVIQSNSGEWRMDSQNVGMTLYFNLNTIEVVGNIFENPELLEEIGELQ